MFDFRNKYEFFLIIDINQIYLHNFISVVIAETTGNECTHISQY